MGTATPNFVLHKNAFKVGVVVQTDGDCDRYKMGGLDRSLS